MKPSLNEGYGDFVRNEALALPIACKSPLSSSRISIRRDRLKISECICCRVRCLCERYKSFSFWSKAISLLNSKTRC